MGLLLYSVDTYIYVNKSVRQILEMFIHFFEGRKLISIFLGFRDSVMALALL